MIKNVRKALMVLMVLVMVTFTNDTYFRVEYVEYNAALRLLDHFLAGMGITIILYLVFGSIYTKGMFYVFWSTSWELQQFVQRGYFQFDQYICDILGVVIAVFLYRKNLLKRVEKEKGKIRYENDGAGAYREFRENRR